MQYWLDDAMRLPIIWWKQNHDSVLNEWMRFYGDWIFIYIADHNCPQCETIQEHYYKVNLGYVVSPRIGQLIRDMENPLL